jgi:hypothetical protein
MAVPGLGPRTVLAAVVVGLLACRIVRVAFPTAKRVMWGLAWAVLGWLTACGSPSRPPNEVGALQGRMGSRVEGVVHAQRLTDGQVPEEGKDWRGPWSTLLRNDKAFVEIDLGAERTLRGAWLQADHNDSYVLSVSRDGRKFEPVWTAGPVRPAGLRMRHTRELSVRARHVRLGAKGGDGRYSVTELLLFDELPAAWPPRIERAHPEPPNQKLRLRIAFATAAICLLLVVARARRPLAFMLLGLGCIIVTADAAREAVLVYPLDGRSISALRAAFACIAAVAVLRLAFVRPHPPPRGLVIAALGVSGVLGFASFFHFGAPQFHDHSRGERSYVHYLDMRVYFPAAKYARELRFDGVYAASVAAFEAIEPEMDRAVLDQTPLRDLRDHRVVRVADVRDHIAEVRARFSTERWNEFVADMRYFVDAMGNDMFLRSMLDHGGNATPLWLANVHNLFDGSRASHALLVTTGLLDPLLLLVLFGAIAWAFGPVAACLTMLLFGAHEVHMGGPTNWAGATLRHDWMVALGLGLCALRRGAPAVGGALLALGGFLRVFPALAFFGIAVVALSWLRDERRRVGRWPGWASLRRAPAMRALGAGAAVSLALFAYASATLGVEAWPQWLHKVGLLSADPRVNHMGVKAMFMYDFTHDLRGVSELSLTSDWVQSQADALASRLPAYYAVAIVFTILLAWASVRQPLERAALFGVSLFIVWLYPANYYLHVGFLLPLIVDAPRSIARERVALPAIVVWFVLCTMCVLEYVAVIEPYMDRHYFMESVLYVAATIACVVVASTTVREAWVGWLRRRLPSRVSAAIPWP